LDGLDPVLDEPLEDDPEFVPELELEEPEPEFEPEEPEPELEPELEEPPFGEPFPEDEEPLFPELDEPEFEEPLLDELPWFEEPLPELDGLPGVAVAAGALPVVVAGGIFLVPGGAEGGALLAPPGWATTPPVIGLFPGSFASVPRTGSLTTLSMVHCGGLLLSVKRPC
jgi:hypothetical protein